MIGVMKPVVRLTDDVFGPAIRGKIVHARGSPNAVAAFRGVPFAEPPIGALRFRPPQQLKLWKGVRDAIEFGEE